MRALLLTVVAFTALSAAAYGASRIRAADWSGGTVCYEVFVRSFHDSDGDGIGDLNGLSLKLDYLNDGDPNTSHDLGVDCIWLMPVTAARSYHGYDVTDYYRINPEYGTNADFRRFVTEAHRRGIRVLVDLVLNHTSREHPYFRSALLDRSSPYRDWYRWSERHPGVRNPWGDDNWHRSPSGSEYYYAFFWSGMPDLNYSDPAVRAEAHRIARYWLDEMQVDGFRLDAVQFLVEEGDSIRHTRGTHEVLRDFGTFVRRIAPRSFTIGEVWDSTGAVLPYYRDQLDAYFSFEASDSIISAVRTGSARGMLSPLLRMQRQVPAYRWGLFLRNHDQTRTSTALGGDKRRAALAATLLFTLPGMPFVYYGEEIGMSGDKPDERLRTPMHWTTGPAAGFTTGVPWEPLQPDSATANVEIQTGDPASLLTLYRRLIRLRRATSALSDGELIELGTTAVNGVAYLRRGQTDAVLVLANPGSDTLRSVLVSGPPGTLPRGRYSGADILDGEPVSELLVRRDGSFAGYVPLPRVDPVATRVVQLRRTR